MIVVRVSFPIEGIGDADFQQAMLDSVPKYEGIDGLIRKYYVSSEDKKIGGGIYLWESREKAESWYDQGWVDRITDAFGSPTLEYLECGIVVDNETSMITKKSAA